MGSGDIPKFVPWGVKPFSDPCVRVPSRICFHNSSNLGPGYMSLWEEGREAGRGVREVRVTKPKNNGDRAMPVPCSKPWLAHAYRDE